MTNDVFSFFDFSDFAVTEAVEKKFMVEHPFVISTFYISTGKCIMKDRDLERFLEMLDLPKMLEEFMYDMEFQSLFSQLKRAETGVFESDSEMRKWSEFFKKVPRV